MLYEMKWLIDRRVITSNLNGAMTSEDIGAFMGDINAMLEQGDPPIHHIIEIRDTGMPNLNLREVNKAVTFDKSRHGWVVVISREMNTFVRFVISVVLEARKVQVHLSQNFDEAQAFLLKMDPALLEQWPEGIQL